MASPEKSLGGKSKSRPKSKAKKSSKHKIRHTHIEHGDDGSHVVRHSFDQGDQGGDPGEAIPDSVHGVSDSSGLLAHLQGQLGGQLPDPNAAGPGAAAAPPAAMQAAG